MNADVKWQYEVIHKARVAGLFAEKGVAVEGAAVVLTAADPWVHRAPSAAILSQGLGAMFAGVVVRWVGVRTQRQQEATQWFASIDAALEAVCNRYASEEAAWRLGG